ncbi:MAG TPA: TfuA-like protein [Chthoniobacterales bacterium]
MSIYIFTGPTISSAEAAVELEAVYLPPAAEGDVYRVALHRPQAIGIIDGYFQSVPAVRHKEILWAMSRGIHVFGSASMGALRAAELEAFGMEGIGIIFGWYRDGVLEDDDEVAVVHGPSTTGCQLASEAMVNIRQTLCKAEMLEVISRKSRLSLEKIGKKLFYPDRNYSILLRSGAERGLPEAELTRLREWLPQGQVNQKKEDALAMLRLMRRRLDEGLAAKTVSYSFQHTAMWESAWHQSSELQFDVDGSPVGLDSLLDELRLESGQYRLQNLLALQRFFGIQEAQRLGMKVTKQSRRDVEAAFRRERGLVDKAQLELWMKENRLRYDEFDALMMDEARLSWIHQRAQFASASSLPQQLRLSGSYARLLGRAMAKQRLLDSYGVVNPSLETAKVTEDQLLSWYFEEVAGQQMSTDVGEHLRGLGYADSHAFRRALLREYLYRHLQQSEQTASKVV